MSSLNAPHKYDISLVIPTLNAAPYLPKALESIVCQFSSDSVEVILVDAASTDNTVEIARSYPGLNVRVIVEEDVSQPAAINRGFEVAQGGILCWLNADDRLHPSTLHRVIGWFADQPSSHFLYGDSIAVDTQGREFGRRSNVGKGQLEQLLDRDFIVQPSAFWTRHAWETAGPLDSSMDYVFDYDFFLTIASKFTLCYLPEVLSYELIHGDAKTSQGGATRADELEVVTIRHGGSGVPSAFRPEVAAERIRQAIGALTTREHDVARDRFRQARSLHAPFAPTIAHLIVGIAFGPAGIARTRLLANRSRILRPSWSHR